MTKVAVFVKYEVEVQATDLLEADAEARAKIQMGDSDVGEGQVVSVRVGGLPESGEAS